MKLKNLGCAGRNTGSNLQTGLPFQKKKKKNVIIFSLVIVGLHTARKDCVLGLLNKPYQRVSTLMDQGQPI